MTTSGQALVRVLIQEMGNDRVTELVGRAAQYASRDLEAAEDAASRLAVQLASPLDRAVALAKGEQ